MFFSYEDYNIYIFNLYDELDSFLNKHSVPER